MTYKFFNHELTHTHKYSFFEPWHQFEYELHNDEYQCEVVLSGGCRGDIHCSVYLRFGSNDSFRLSVNDCITPEQALSALEAKVRDHINGITKALGMSPYEG